MSFKKATRINAVLATFTTFFVNCRCYHLPFGVILYAFLKRKEKKSLRMHHISGMHVANAALKQIMATCYALSFSIESLKTLELQLELKYHTNYF